MSHDIYLILVLVTLFRDQIWYPPGYRIWSREKVANDDVCKLVKCPKIHGVVGTRCHLTPFSIVSPVCDGLAHRLCTPWGAPHRKGFALILPMRVLNCPQTGNFLCPRLSIITQLLVECHKWNLVYFAEFIVLGQTALLFVGKRWKWHQEYYHSRLDNLSTLKHCKGF